MKKFISVFLSLTLLFAMITFVSADKFEPVNSDNNKKTIITEITEDEYIKIVSQHSGISEDKVKNKIKEYKDKISKKSVPAEVGYTATTNLSYLTAITTNDFSSGISVSTPVELGMAYTVYTYGSFRQVNSIDSVWTGATGSGFYTWSEFYNNSYPSSFPATNIEAHARGVVETQIDLSISGSAEIKQELIGCGFSVSATVGTTVYLRKTGDLDLYVNLY